MAKRNVITMVSLIVVMACAVFGIAKPVKKSKPLVCVGIFDSRAVACAWGRSKVFQKQIRDMRAEHKKAEAEGNTKRMSELEKEAPKRQDRMHKQVFGNEPIDDVLKKIEKNLPEIAKSAGVDMIVSKWEIAYQKKSAKFVNVTWEMVNLLEPDEETVKVIRQLIKQKPVPSEELEMHEH
jgi:hypothetical protein